MFYPRFISIILFSSITIIALGRPSPKRVLKKLGESPVYVVDSVNIDKADLMKYKPEQIAAVTVLNGKDAIDRIGEDGKDGVVYIETILFAKVRYWNYFKSKSPEYLALVPIAGQDTTVQYILNDKVLDKYFEGNLASIDDKIFKEIRVLDKETLKKEYGIEGKEAGVLIKSDRPKNLYKGRQKF